MANLTVYAQTNFFQVNDEEGLKELVAKVGAELEEKMLDGIKRFSFRNDDSVVNYFDLTKGYMVDIFEELQQLIPEGEAAIIQEVGFGKSDTLSGSAHIVTKHHIEHVSLFKKAVETAHALLQEEKKK